jgi:adenylate cyclase
MALVNRGWGLVMLGEPATGIPILRDGIAAVEATGARLIRSTYLAMLAAVATFEGDPAATVRLIEEAFDEIERSGERVQEAGLLVARNQLLTFAGRLDEQASETCLRRAIDVARAQGSRLLELRAAIALARHAPFADARIAVPEIVAARQLLSET